MLVNARSFCARPERADGDPGRPIRATAAAHDRDPDELALELVHLLATEETPEALDATPAIPALTTDHDDTVRILLPLKTLE